MFGADLLPQPLEGRRRSGEVNAGQPRICQCHFRYRIAIAGGPCLTTPGGSPGRPPAAAWSGRPTASVSPTASTPRCFPISAGAGGQISRDRGEVEWCYRVDESVQRTVVGCDSIHRVALSGCWARICRAKSTLKPPENPPSHRTRRSRPDRRFWTGPASSPPRSSLATDRQSRSAAAQEDRRPASSNGGCRPIAFLANDAACTAAAASRCLGVGQRAQRLPRGGGGCTTSIRSPLPMRWVATDDVAAGSDRVVSQRGERRPAAGSARPNSPP